MSNADVAIIDLIRKKEEHYVFNYLTIKAIGESFNVQAWLSDDATFLHELNPTIKVNRINIIRTKLYLWLTSTLQLISIIFKLPKQTRKVIVLSATPFQYAILSLVSIMSSKEIFVFMHGELGYLKSASGLGQRIGSGFIRFALRIGKVRFICISSSICESISNIFKKRKFWYVQHPIISVSESNLPHDDYSFGSFGVHSADKGSEKIYELADYLTTLKINNAKLITVGVSDGHFSFDKNDRVEHFCKGFLNNSLISKDEFYSNVRRINVALIFSNVSAVGDRKYDLVSSGVLADCIAFKMPIIAIRNSQLTHYFEKYGRFGILCDSVHDMALAIESVVDDSRLIPEFKQVLDRVREDFKFDGFKVKVEEILMHD